MKYFNDLASTYIRDHESQWRSNKNARIISDIMRDFIGYSINEMTFEAINTWKVAMLRTRKPSTVNRKLALLKAIFTHANDLGLTQENPCHNLKLAKVSNRNIRFLSDSEEEGLTRDLGYGILFTWMRDLIIVGLDTGMRLGELLNLTHNNLDFKNQQIRIKQSKTGREKMIPMSERVYSVLANGGIKWTGKPERTVNKVFHLFMDEAGIKNFRFHDLRHTFASKLAIKGVPIYVISELLGHTNIQMTMRYAHLSPKAKREAIELL